MKRFLALGLVCLSTIIPAQAEQSRVAGPASLRLYVFDCGKLEFSDATVPWCSVAISTTTRKSVPSSVSPTIEFNPQQSAHSRAAIEAFLRKTGAQLWIEHDLTANAKLRKSPAFYD